MSSLILNHKERAEGPWVKLQSEPSLFTSLMYSLGVKGAKATEVFVLDQQDNFDDLGEIYGLVFLFKMIGDVSGDVKGLHRDAKYEPIDELPKNVYFANQVVENACATLAVLNIVLNCPQLEIDQELKEFKEFTRELPPATRGFAITNHPNFRQIHNSMSRHPEEALVVEEAVTTKKGRGKKIIEVVGEAYHYIAYVPVDGEAWQLDGLYPHPVSLGKYSNEKKWYEAARGEINARINGFFVEQIEYVLLAITKDELGVHQDRIKDCMYIKSLAENRLDKLSNSWREVDSKDIDLFFTNEDEIRVINRGNYVADFENLTSYHDNIENIKELRTRMVNTIQSLLEEIEIEKKRKEVEKERRTFDYCPFFREFISILQERGDLERLLDAAEDMDERDEYI
ncbi:cysteine proteinase [Gigaspora margarita]|uniref:Ubiquitin carboxyl-terminal hydrolase n=1 Tax=Gigaspora margarita TaxID=4874 RepID=A0A8H4ASJ4_GIGMA|nr:cysteine proteinase [Gigaspora margarita]